MKATTGATVNLKWKMCLAEWDRNKFLYIEFGKHSGEVFEAIFKIDKLEATVIPPYHGLVSLSGYRRLESYEFTLYNLSLSNNGIYEIRLTTVKGILLNNSFKLVVYYEGSKVFCHFFQQSNFSSTKFTITITIIIILDSLVM